MCSAGHRVSVVPFLFPVSPLRVHSVFQWCLLPGDGPGWGRSRGASKLHVPKSCHGRVLFTTKVAPLSDWMLSGDLTVQHGSSMEGPLNSRPPHLQCGWRQQCRTWTRCLLQSVRTVPLRGWWRTRVVCLPGQARPGTPHSLPQFPLPPGCVAGSLGTVAMHPWLHGSESLVLEPSLKL